MLVCKEILNPSFRVHLKRFVANDPRLAGAGRGGLGLAGVVWGWPRWFGAGRGGLGLAGPVCFFNTKTRAFS